MTIARSIASVARATAVGTALASPLAIGGDTTDMQLDSRSEVLHITITGDLDSTRLALDFAQAITDRKPATDALMLELDGDRWRRDVVWMIAQSIRESGLESAVYLGDRTGKRVGMGQLVLGLIADSCSIAPNTTITLTPGDDLESLAPETTDWERVDRELAGLLWVAMRDRGLPGALGEALIKPTTSVWIVRSSAGVPTEVFFEPPATGRADRLIDARPDGSASARIDAVLARELGLVGSISKTVRTELTRLGLARARVEHITLTSGLTKARAQARTLLDRTDALTRQADARLTRLEHPIDRRVVPISVRAQQGYLALDEIDAARATLARTEAFFDEMPELLAMDAPAGTRVGRTPAGNRSDWRYAFTSRTRTLDRLADRARDHIARAGGGAQ